MTIRVTPVQFAQKMNKVAVAVKTQDKKAITARATVMQKIIETGAANSSGLGRKYARSGRWVRTKPLGRDAAMINLRTGFGHLAERGSYRYPSGWDMIGTNSPVLSWGPNLAAASVHHPALRAHPFWRASVHVADKPGLVAYQKSMHDTIYKAIH